jgi:quaternary ammonium compound-resistance protein SugE
MDGFTKIVPGITTIVFYVLSAIFLSHALKKLSLGTAYAMWTGFGIVGTSILGIILFREILNAAQVICIVLIVCGIVGLKIF